jgi:hypothetical protein
MICVSGPSACFAGVFHETNALKNKTQTEKSGFYFLISYLISKPVNRKVPLR